MWFESFTKRWGATSEEFLRIAAEWMESNAVMVMLLRYCGVKMD
jgi:hypothetical protein